MQLADDIFGSKINNAILYQAINMYRANRRAGTASTKTRSEVRGGGRKPWRQKHTGRARAGSIRSPLWRGGGKVFGPHPRDYSYPVPRKIIKQALAIALIGKFTDRELFVVDRLEEECPSKTKEASLVISRFRNNGTILVVMDSIKRGSNLGLRSLDKVTLTSADNLNAFNILNHNRIIVSKSAFNKLVARITRII